MIKRLLINNLALIALATIGWGGAVYGAMTCTEYFCGLGYFVIATVIIAPASLILAWLLAYKAIKTPTVKHPVLLGFISALFTSISCFAVVSSSAYLSSRTTEDLMTSIISIIVILISLVLSTKLIQLLVYKVAFFKKQSL